MNVSAKQRINLDGLEEMICLQADLRDIKATPDRPAVGTVIEAKLDRGRGAVASVLVQNGTLRTGDSYIVGNTFGKIRAMFDDRGRPILRRRDHRLRSRSLVSKACRTRAIRSW